MSYGRVIPSFLMPGTNCTMKATLKKVDKMASNQTQRWRSAVYNLEEFARLGYPAEDRKWVCYAVANDGDATLWQELAKWQDWI